MQTEKELLLQSYIRLADFLSNSRGVGYETSVYEIHMEGDAIRGEVAAAFGQNNSRKKGDPLTLFLEQIVRSLKENSSDGVTHVDTEASTAEGRVRLSIFAIRDSGNEVVGLFLFQVEIDLMYQLRDAIDEYLGLATDLTAVSQTKFKATSSMSEESAIRFSDYMQQRIHDEIISYGIPIERMTNEERTQIIRRLEQMEVFFMKDSVKTTAELLGISVPTVYRLMKHKG